MFAWSRVEAEPRLVEEHRDELLVLGQVGKDALDRNLLLHPLDQLGFGPINLGHAPAVELVDDPVFLFGASHGLAEWERRSMVHQFRHAIQTWHHPPPTVTGLPTVRMITETEWASRDVW